MTRLVRRLLLPGAIALVSLAHVGSPDAWFDGAAGPYAVTVHIEAPPVVPGIAIVNVNARGEGVTRVTAFVNTYDAEGGTPPPDELAPAADRPGWRRAQLWVMNAGSNRVTVQVEGSLGSGAVVVPLAAVAQRRLRIGPAFTVLMSAVGAILTTGMLTLVGAAVREGSLEPGLTPDVERRRRARRAMARGAVVIVLVLAGTGAWWRAEDRAFRQRLYRPLSISTVVDTSSGASRFVLVIDDSTWLQRDEIAVLRARGEGVVSGLVDDHGKLMHLFLVSEDGRSAMAHLHPMTTDTVTFTSALPALPPGGYRVFADIVHQSGFTQTLTSRVDMPPVSNVVGVLSDADDSWAAVAGTDGHRVRLDDGTTLSWIRDSLPIRSDEEAGLRFVVERPEYDIAPLEPYLGMPGHAVVVREDGQVFIHLHPMGTISPAAQARLSPASVHPPEHLGRTVSDTLSFPYAFPEPGNYTIWVQLKRNGRVLTGGFQAVVLARR